MEFSYYKIFRINSFLLSKKCFDKSFVIFFFCLVCAFLFSFCWVETKAFQIKKKLNHNHSLPSHNINCVYIYKYNITYNVCLMAIKKEKKKNRFFFCGMMVFSITQKELKIKFVHYVLHYAQCFFWCYC